jgi:hypothetical protein
MSFVDVLLSWRLGVSTYKYLLIVVFFCARAGLLWRLECILFLLAVAWLVRSVGWLGSVQSKFIRMNQ